MISDVLRQRTEPHIVPTGAVVGVYKIESGEELERSIKVRRTMDVPKLLHDLSSDECWLIYVKHGGQTTVIAMSQKMEAALCPPS